MEFDIGFFPCRTFGPRTELLAQARFHLRRVKISHHAQNDVVGIEVLFVPVHHVRLSDSGNGGIFRHARVRIVSAVGELEGLARGDLCGIVIAPRDSIEGLALRQLQFLLTKCGFAQQIQKDLKNIVEVAFQT